MLRTLRILAAGQVVEDIDMYGRVYSMVYNRMPFELVFNDFVEGFGLSEKYGYPNNRLLNSGVGLDSSRVVLSPLLCGMFNQSKFLPMKYMSRQVELKVVSA